MLPDQLAGFEARASVPPPVHVTVAAWADKANPNKNKIISPKATIFLLLPCLLIISMYSLFIFSPPLVKQIYIPCLSLHFQDTTYPHSQTSSIISHFPLLTSHFSPPLSLS